MAKLNLTVLLKHFDLKNMSVYEAYKSNDAERKELEQMLQYILPLWVSGVATAREQIEILFNFNEHINEGWWELGKHPELQAKLLASIGLGKQVKHDFQYRHKKNNTNKLNEFLRLRYPDVRIDEIRLWCLTNSEKVLSSLLDDYGIQNSEQTIILSEYRKVLECL